MGRGMACLLRPASNDPALYTKMSQWSAELLAHATRGAGHVVGARAPGAQHSPISPQEGQHLYLWQPTWKVRALEIRAPPLVGAHPALGRAPHVDAQEQQDQGAPD